MRTKKAENEKITALYERLSRDEYNCSTYNLVFDLFDISERG